MAIKNKNREKSFLAKDFKGFRSGIQEYIENYYSDKISDFSESSLAGMFVDMAAYIGDNMSYYLDFQFNELDLETAVDIKNIQKHLRSAGISARGPSPARANVLISLRIPSSFNTTRSNYVPDPNSLPVLRSGATVVSSTGIQFELIEDLDFNRKDENGSYLFSYRIDPDGIDEDGNPSFFIVERTGEFISGKTVEESISIGSSFVPFRRVTLQNPNINEIISVLDSQGNLYYEVDNLTQDVVFETIPNYRYDERSVKDILQIRPAARRFITDRSLDNGLVTLVFGSGNESNFENDLMPSPEEISLNLYGRRNFTNFSIDTNNILKTDTLGISPVNTVLTVRYRTGGGLSHNVKENTINTISSFTLDFKPDSPISTRTGIRNSMQIRNLEPASGGENQPTLEELRFIGVNSRSQQSRIVSKEDLISRVYTMPSSLGKVFRAAVVSNLDNPFSASLYVLTRDIDGNISSPSDTMKKNIKTFLNRFRLVSDSIDIVDAPVANVKIEYEVVVDPFFNKNSVINTINTRLASFMEIDSFQIGTPIVKSDLRQIIRNVSGVTSIVELKISNISGQKGDFLYSEYVYNIKLNEFSGIVYPPEGGIFQLKFPQSDITGLAY